MDGIQTRLLNGTGFMQNEIGWFLGQEWHPLLTGGIVIGCYALAYALAIRTRHMPFGISHWLILLLAGLVFLAGSAWLLSLQSLVGAGWRFDVAGWVLLSIALVLGAYVCWPVKPRAARQLVHDAARLQELIRQLEYEIAERKRAEAAWQQSQNQLRQLAAHQERVKEDERKRIAREIHDELGQNLMALRIELSVLQTHMTESHPDLVEKTALALGQIDASIRAVRCIINNLRPSVLDLGLFAAIEWQVNEFQRRTGIACSIVCDGSDLELDDDRATALFRILQESLTNVARHARATKVQIELRRTADMLHMKIADNGVGIYPGCRRKPNSFGLLGIGERISSLGGEFTVESGPGPGTQLSMIIPIPAKAQTA